MYAEAGVIYADIFFLINFSLDYLCLFITGRLLGCGMKGKRLAAASLLGSIYAFLPYIFEFGTAFYIFLNLAAGIFICFVAFGKRTFKKFAVICMTFIASGAMLGGVITAVYSLSGQYSSGYADMSALKFVGICLVSALAAGIYGRICRKRISVASAEVRIYANGEKMNARLLCDSGNLVTEPFSALPVMIISSTALPFPFDRPESEAFPLPVRAIPFSTSAGKGCFMGFRPDKIELLIPGKKAKCTEAYIAVDTTGSTYSGYDGIMPTSIL